MMSDKFIKATSNLSIYNMPYKNNTFDAVFIGEIIEHLENPYKAMIEVSRVLKNNGILYLSTPNKLRYQSIIKALKGYKYCTKIKKVLSAGIVMNLVTWSWILF